MARQTPTLRHLTHTANQSSMATEALRQIGELYEIERRGKDPDAAGCESLRRAEVQPKLEVRLAGLRPAECARRWHSESNDYALKR